MVAIIEIPAEDVIYSALGFKVKNGQIQTAEMRENFEGKQVPKGVRPATYHEIALWEALVAEYTSHRVAGKTIT